MPDTLCAMCGAPIVPAGEAWDHVGEPKPRHPAIPVGEWPPMPEFRAAPPCPLCGSLQTAQDGPKAWCNECDTVGPRDAWAEASGWRARLSALEAQAKRDAPLVAAALAWLPEHAEYTAGCATCEALVEAARAHRAAAVDGDNPTED
jgi:hypothetical protein